MEGLLGGKKKAVAATGAVLVTGFLLLAAAIGVIASSVTSGSSHGNYDMEDLPEIITQEMIDGALESEKKYGVPAALTLAQIILESSGSCPGGLSQLAYDCHNLFGMKGIGPAGYKEYVTREETEAGVSYTVTAKFRKYHNVKESIDDHGQLLSSGHYAAYTKGCKTADEWAVAIHKAGYATATNYSSKLIELMGTYGLYQFSMDTYSPGDGIAKGKLLWPTVKDCTITSYFGLRDAPTQGASKYHEGIDISAYNGAPVYAAEGGKVIQAGDAGGSGNMITLDHGKGIQTTYMHLKNGGILVRVGQKVSRGQKIGLMGSTGISTGVHLDFRIIINGKKVDPLKYVKKP